MKLYLVWLRYGWANQHEVPFVAKGPNDLWGQICDTMPDWEPVSYREVEP